MIADFIRHYPAYTAEAVLRMPARQFLALRCAYAGYPDDAPGRGAVEEAESVISDMARWREKHGRAALPRAGEGGEA